MHRILQNKQLALVNWKGLAVLHTTQDVTFQGRLNKLKELDYEVLPHPPYSPGLSLTHFHLYRNLDNFIHGKIVENDMHAKKHFLIAFQLRAQKFSVLELRNWFHIEKSVFKIMVNILSKIILVIYFFCSK